MISRGHRRRLNRAIHELRRPLQALTLVEDGPGPPPGSPPAAGRRGLLELVCAALDDLDRTVNNGGAPQRTGRPFCCRELLLASLERWRPAAAVAGGFKVFWDAGPALVEGDPVRIVAGVRQPDRQRARARWAAAGDHRRHGRRQGPGDRRQRSVREWRDELGGMDGDPRHGHGTAVVSEVASAHRGRFALCRTGGGCVAALELPLADPRYARAA